MVVETRDLLPFEGGDPVADELNAPRGKRARVRVRDVLIVIAGIAGALSIIWLVVSLVFGYSLIVFKTGSMAPSMPTGALAIERNIPVADIRAGDVVTVADPGHQLPVTHRVVSVKKDVSQPTARVLVLKGDANATNDQTPYTVTTAKTVIWSVPVAGTILVGLRQPIVIGFITLLVATLIVWSFWPTSEQNRPRYRRGSTPGAAASSHRFSQGENE
jgi:signal peptidase